MSSTLNPQRAFALLETAICCAVLLPILYLAYAVFDYWQDCRALRALTNNFAQAAPIKPMHLHSGWHGFYVRARDRTPGADKADAAEKGDLETETEEETEAPPDAEILLSEYARRQREQFYGEFQSWLDAYRAQVMGSALCQKLTCTAATVRLEMQPAVLQINQNSGVIYGIDYPEKAFHSYGKLGASLQADLRKEIEARAQLEAPIPSALFGGRTRQLYGLMSGRDFGATSGLSLNDDKATKVRIKSYLKYTNAKRNYVRFSAMLGVALQIDVGKSFFATLLPKDSSNPTRFQAIEVATLRKGF